MNGTKNFRRVKIGGVSLISVAIMIIIIILANVAVNTLPTSYTKYSVSSLGIYDISDSTKELVSGVEDKIDIYVVAAESYRDDVIYEYCKRLSDLSSNVSASFVDPVVKPTFVAKYTDEEIDSSETNIIVVNTTQSTGDTVRAKLIPYSDIYYSEYSDYEVYYYQMMGYDVTNTTYFDCEACLATAIDYVTTDKLPKIYYTSGHSETAIDSTVAGLIEDENIEVEELALLTAGSIPEDADLVIMHTPTLDITEDEATAIKTYIDGGGKFILTTGVGNNVQFYSLTNLYALAEEYGMIYNEALVMEGSSSHYYQAPYYILPEITDNDFSDAVPDNSYVVLPLAHEIKIAETLPDDVTVETLFTTTTKGYVKENIGDDTNFSAKQDDDREGTIVVGAMASKDEGRFMWIAATDILTGATASSFSNITYMMSAITNLCDKESTVTASAKALAIEALTVTDGTSSLWGIILICIIPLAILVTGIVVWRRRATR